MADANLSKWDFAVEFLLYEAAALVVGIDPAEIYIETKPAKDNPRIFDYHEHPQIKPVVDRMKLSFFDAYELCHSMRDGGWTSSYPEPLPNGILRSRSMMVVPLEIGSPYWPLDPATRKALEDWYASDQDHLMYETARFARQEIVRWLSVNQFCSVYQFDLAPSSGAQATVEKQLGDRERTTLLNVIGALVELIKTPRPGRSSDKAVIDELLDNYSDKAGISARTLQEKFAAAKRSLQSA